MKIFVTIIGILISLSFQSSTFANVLEIPFSAEDVKLDVLDEDRLNDREKAFLASNPDDGIRQANTAILVALNFFSIILGVIAATWLVWQGVRMISSGGDESQYESAERNVIWAIIALTVSFVVEPFVLNVIYGGGPNLTPGEAIFNPSVSVTGSGVEELRGIINWIKTFVGIIAVFMIFLTGTQAMINVDSDEEFDKQRTNIRWIVIGIIILIFNEILVRTIYSDPTLENNRPNVVQNMTLFINELGGLVQFIITLLGLGALAAAVYAGYMILTASFNEEQAETGKKILRNVAIGIVVVLISFALISNVITLQS